ncbi:hypothetical protein IFR05_005422 [Cadophora sp. M221]|nr:hypothetical protein IFR05_005422 [Cadophora sp. M221]
MAEKGAEAEGEAKGEAEGEDTGCRETTRPSQDTSMADQDTHDKKRRKISEWTGLVYKYQNNLVLKIYKDGKTFHNELRVYLQISASPLSNKAPRFAEQILLPEYFFSRRFTNRQLGDLEFIPYSFGLIFQQLNGPLLSELLDRVCPQKPWLDHLENSIKTVLQDLHDLNISHADVKSNNFILRTQELKEPNSIIKSNNFNDDCFIIDFGEAVFQSDCSPKHWKGQCQVDLIDASLMFAVPRAQLAITSLTQWLHPHCAIQSSHEHNSSDLDSLALVFSTTDITQPTFEQERFLISTLRAAAALPVKAIPFVNILVKRISSPSLALVEINIEIFCSINNAKAAIKYIDKQLTPVCICHRTMQHQNATTISLYQHKINILRKYNYGLAYRIKTLQAAVCFSDKHCEDVIDTRTFELRRELSLTLYNQGEMDQARSLYNISLQVLNKERNDRADKRTDGADDTDQNDTSEQEGDTDSGGSGDARADAMEDAMEDAKWILRDWTRTLDERDRVAEVRRSRGLQ